MTGGRWPGRDRGSFTAEFAAGLPAVMLLLLVGLTTVGAAATKVQCVDAARDGALAAARGEPGPAAAAEVAPPGADVEVRLDPESVTVVVRSRIRAPGGNLPVITVAATAVPAREPGVPGANP